MFNEISVYYTKLGYQMKYFPYLSLKIIKK